MKLIFLYGAPGIGKLTISQEIEKKSNMKVFHNHLSYDFASAFFEPFSYEFNQFREELVLITLNILVKSNIEGLIFTFCYSKTDYPSIKKLQKVFENNEIDVSYFLITCSIKENLKRVTNENRKIFNKLTDPTVLLNLYGDCKFDEAIPNTNSKIIDNTNMLPEEVAEIILKRK